MCWHLQVMQNDCTDCTFGKNLLGTAGNHSDFIFITSDNSPFRDDPAGCFFSGLFRLGKGCALSLPCFSGCPFAVKSLNNLALFSLTIWAIPHHTNYLPALPLLTYLIFFPLPIPPSLFPGTLLHHNKLQFLSHSFTQMKSPRNSSALPGPFSPSSRYAIP